MDVLFRQVFYQQPFIRKNIFYQVVNDSNCKTVNYRYCYGLNWMIEDRYFELLKLKLRNKEYLHMGKVVIWGFGIFKIRDLDIFKQILPLYSQYNRDYYGAVEHCCRNENWVVAKYLIEQKTSYSDTQVLEIVTEKGSVEMLEYLLQFPIAGIVVVTLNTFLYAIVSKNQRLVSMVFECGRHCFVKLYPEEKDRVLVAAMSSGSQEIFRIVQKHYERSFYFFAVRKRSFYHKELVWKLLNASVVSFVMFKYCVDMFGIPLVSTTAAVDHQDESSGSSDLCRIKDICLAAIGYGQGDIVGYLISKGLVNHGTTTPPPVIVGELDKAKYIVEYLQIPIKQIDLEKSIRSTEVFKYLYESSKGSEVHLDPSFINNIISQAYIDNNIDMVIYLHQQGLLKPQSRDSVVWSSLLHMDPNNCTNMLNTLFTLHYPTHKDIPSLIRGLENFALRSKRFKVFQMLFDHIYQHISRDHSLYYNCFKLTARGGRLVSLRYLFEQGLLPEDPLKVLQEAAHTGVLSILKYLIENHDSFKNAASNTTSLLEKSIANNHLDCVEYLIPLCSANIPNLPNSTFCSLANENSLMILKYLMERSEFSKERFKITLLTAIEYGYADITQ